MKRSLYLALSSFLALASVPSAQLAVAPAASAAASATAIVHQSHGTVPRTETYCGYHVVVSGAPGTRFRVYATPPGGATAVMVTGILPAAGTFVTAVFAGGCSPHGPIERVSITSSATDVIDAAVAYL